LGGLTEEVDRWLTIPLAAATEGWVGKAQHEREPNSSAMEVHFFDSSEDAETKITVINASTAIHSKQY
jgi:hypothetical protein